jgi:hypothetical protein
MSSFHKLVIDRVFHCCVSELFSITVPESEAWSLAVREESKLRVFENRVLGRIFGPKGDEVTGKWRKLLNEEFNDPYCSPNIVRVIKSRRMR